MCIKIFAPILIMTSLTQIAFGRTFDSSFDTRMSVEEVLSQLPTYCRWKSLYYNEEHCLVLQYLASEAGFVFSNNEKSIQPADHLELADRGGIYLDSSGEVDGWIERNLLNRLEDRSGVRVRGGNSLKGKKWDDAGSNFSSDAPNYGNRQYNYRDYGRR